MRFFICCICLIVSQSTSLHAKRVALVIGNDDYAHVTKLQKAVNDARAVAATIRSIGFEVFETINANRRVFDMELNKLNAQIEAGDEVIFFFAGHGISVRGRNYLLPIDVPAIKPGQERSVTKEAFSEDEIINLLQERGVKVSLLIIDACRNNPFPKKGTRSLGRSVGLSERSTPPRNTFVMYSAGFGQEALDRLSDNDQNPNSVFTRKLLPLLKTPGLSHIRMAKRLQIEVEQLALSSANKHQQFPAFYDQVRGDFYLVPGNDITTRKDPIQNDKPVTGADEVLWMTIETSNKASDFEFYLSKFPNGKFAAVAELKIRQLKDNKLEAVNKKQNLDNEQSDTLFQQAEDYFYRPNRTDKDLQQALRLSKQSAALGHSGSMYRLGVIYYDGMGVSSDKALAHSWFEKAFHSLKKQAVAGDPMSQFFIGVMYSNGYFVRKDKAQSFDWYTKASDQGHVLAKGNLGNLYRDGRGVDKDYKKAIELYKTSANQGNALAMVNLGKLYMDGVGVETDYSVAMEWFLKAAQKGNSGSMTNIGLMYYLGNGVKQDYSKAFDWYQKAVVKKNPAAMHNLAVLYDQGHGVEKDTKKAADWIIRALREKYKFTLNEMVENSNAWSVELREELQGFLKKERLYSGSIDGNFGTETIKALKKLAL